MALWKIEPTWKKSVIERTYMYKDDKEIIELFNQFIEVANGKINLGYQKGKNSLLTRIVRKISQNYDGRPNSIQDFVDEVAKICKKYPDLCKKR